jgi:uncharacterized membrane protein YgcG
MRLYTASSEETLRARKLLKDWAGEGYLTKEQGLRLGQEAVSELRTTNIFLRLVLILFTLIIVAGTAALFLQVSRPSDQTSGIFLLIFAAVSYAAAEVAASQARLYRYGIEESLAACSVAFLCAGLMLAIFSGGYTPKPYLAHSVVPVVGVVSSLWIWHRFGLWYAFLAAMIFAAAIPDYWTSSRWAQHLMIVVFYTVALIFVSAVRPRHRFDYLDEHYSTAEALLWLGIYLAINLQLSSLNIRAQWWLGTQAGSEFPSPFYWTTWVLIWCLPPVILARGVRQKDRFVIAVGTIAAILTFVTNKPYLGWQRHTWDPILLGILLSGVALYIRRWLARGPDGIRHGFTAARLSGRDKRWMSIGSAALGLVSPQSITPSAQTKSPDVRFGGGASGGGGAGGDF